MRRAGWVFVLAALVVPACGEAPYVYQPTALVSASVEGLPASRYEVPPESPRGEAMVASFGVTHMDRLGGDAEFVHARLVVANNNDEQPWTIDPGQQLLALPGHTPIAPGFVNAGVQVQPQVSIPPGQKVAVDLFYPLPEDVPKASALPGFDLLWQVQTPKRAVAERTSFERLRLAPPPDPYFAYAWADRWWADPWWYGPIAPGWAWRDPLAPRFVVVNRPPNMVVHRPHYVARPTPVHPAPPAHPAAPVHR
jgi:hypothetical protein